MAVNYRDGDVSYHTAAKVLHVKYDTVHQLVRAKKLDGGKYPLNERGRFVTWASVLRLHKERLLQKELVQ